MSEPEKKSSPTRKATDQVDCLKQLKAAGATPREMTIYGLVNFAIPSMWKSLMAAIVAVVLYGVLR
jgi:hypothetical protein